jgi:hypothetical protein
VKALGGSRVGGGGHPERLEPYTQASSCVAFRLMNSYMAAVVCLCDVVYVGYPRLGLGMEGIGVPGRLWLRGWKQISISSLSSPSYFSNSSPPLVQRATKGYRWLRLGDVFLSWLVSV